MIDEDQFAYGEQIRVTLAGGRTFTGAYCGIDWAQANETGVDSLCIQDQATRTLYGFDEDEIARIEKADGTAVAWHVIGPYERDAFRAVRTPQDAADAPFMRYFRLVQSAARERGSVFFLDTDEGGEGPEVGGMAISDLSGWLVPRAVASSFEEVWRDGSKEELDCLYTDDYYCFAEWGVEDGEVTVTFTRY